MEERCIICGEIIPEGRQVCPGCEAEYDSKKAEDTKKAAIKRKLTREVMGYFRDEYGKKGHYSLAESRSNERVMNGNSRNIRCP